MADISRRLEKAEKSLQRGKHQDALKELLRATEEDPYNDAVKLQAADLSATLHQSDDAVRLYSQVFDHQASTGDIGAATLTYKKISHLTTPPVALALRFAGLIERSNRDEALGLYRSAVDGLQKSPEKAMEAQKRVLALAPTAEEYERMAGLQMASGQQQAAGESLLKAAEQSKAAGDLATAFEYLKAAYEADPENRMAALEFGSSLIERQLFGEATHVLAQLASAGDADAIGPYARALMEAGLVEEAEPYVWAEYERDHAAIAMIGELMKRQVSSGNVEGALALAHRVEVRETGHRRRRDFILMVKELVMRAEPDAELLSYAAELLNSANREHDYCEVLGRLFDLHFACGQFEKAADALDRAGEVDPYDQANQRRLAALTGKLNDQRFAAVASRFGKAAPMAQEPDVTPAQPAQPTVLEDLMLQAEIFLQYGMRARAIERLQRIQRLFPGEEINNPRLLDLYDRAAFGSPEASATAASSPAAVAPSRAEVPVSAPEHVSSRAPAAEDQINRIAQVSRNIFRQANVEAVLFTAVNDIGRLLGATRCISALCSPGGPPSAFAEYCGPRIQRSEIDALVNAIMAGGKELKIEASSLFAALGDAPEPLKQACSSLGIQSLALARLSIRDEFMGLVIAGHAQPHDWSKYESAALALLADSVALSAQTAKLRKMLDALAPREERTGLLKRGSYFDALAFEISRSLQNQTPLSLALLRVVAPAEPTHELMQKTAQNLLSYLRQTDVAVRYDQSTIALVLGGTSEQAGEQAVSKLRRVLSAEKYTKALKLCCGLAEVALQPDFDAADIATEVANRAELALAGAIAQGPGSTMTVPQPLMETV